MADEPLFPSHDHTTLTFPEGFLWGAATSANQVEGNNIHSDWWDWEQTAQPPEKRSGLACDQYNRYEEDFDLAKKFNHNAHRLSIEWARIEPEDGQFDTKEIEHYQKVLKALKDRGMKVMLTLHHFTNPVWFAQKGGWENLKAPFYFERFVKTVVPQLKDYVDLWITINEPGIYAWMGYLGGDESGRFPPCKKSSIAAGKVIWNMVRAHKKAYKAIHKIVPTAQVGVAQNVQSYTASHKHSPIEQLGVIFSDLFANHAFTFLTRGHHDFLGVNYYFHYRLEKEAGLLPGVVDVTKYSHNVSDLGWEIYPQGIFDCLADLADGLPIYITECGIATTNDDRRVRFLIQYLQEIYHGIKANADVRGFFYWSLLDNMEVHRGFDPKFGLIEVDFKTQKRTPRPSAKVYAEIIKNNGIPHSLMKFLGHGIKVEEVIKS